MKPISHYCFMVSLALAATGICHPVNATTLIGQDKLRIHNSFPKRTQDSLFSYTVEWRIDKGELYRASALSFLNGQKLDGSGSASLVTKKLVTALKDGLTPLDPNWRGITVDQQQDQAIFLVANKAGYSLTNITLRDYSNQALRFDLVDKRFSEAGVQVAIDLVYTADVEYIDGFTTRKAQTASKGEIIVKIDDEKVAEIKTDGKTTDELEVELAEHLAAGHHSKTPLFPVLSSSDTRNIKPFDNSEVQFLNLEAKSISIDVSDPELGVITKFKYLDNNGAVKILEPRLMMVALAVVSLLTVTVLWIRNKRKTA